jgi:hypothetical protein
MLGPHGGVSGAALALGRVARYLQFIWNISGMPNKSLKELEK